MRAGGARLNDASAGSEIPEQGSETAICLRIVESTDHLGIDDARAIDVLEGLPYNHEAVADILDSLFKAKFWARQFLPITSSRVNWSDYLAHATRVGLLLH